MEPVVQLEKKTSVVNIASNLLFSTRYFAAGLIAQNNYPVFVAGIGALAAQQGFIAPIVNMPEAYTNLMGNGKLPQGKAFRVKSIGVAIKYQIDAAAAPAANDIAGAQDLVWSTSLAYIQLGRTTELGALRHWPAGSGLSITGGAFAQAVAANINRVVANNGTPGQYAVRELDVPLDIRPNVEFSFLLRVQDVVTLPAITLVAVDLYGQQVESLGQMS